MSSPAFRIVHNGVLRDADTLPLDCEDGLFRFGYGVFETLAAYRGNPFLAERHFERLQASSTHLGLNAPTARELGEAIDLVLTENSLRSHEQIRLRITLSSPPSGKSCWWVEASLPPLRPATARVATGVFVRNEQSPLAGHKTSSCAENVIADRAAKAAGIDEMLFLNTRGELCEGTWSNVFVRDESGWKTPPLDSGCLPGITRALVLDLAAESGITILESTLLGPSINRVQSAFLTSSIREIQPVSSLNGRDLEIAKEISILQAAYRERVKRNCPP